MNFRLRILFALAGFLFSCTKSVEKESAAGSDSSFELTFNLPGPSRFYELGDLAIIGEQPYASVVSAADANLGAPFLFRSQNDWRIYEQAGQRFVTLTSYKGVLYGIMEYTQPYQAGQLTAYRYTYYLYKWENSGFKNVGEYAYTDHNNVQNSPLQSLQFVKWQNDLRLVGKTSTGIALLWNLSQDKFKFEREIGNTGRSVYIMPSSDGISFTSYYQINGPFDSFDYTKWHYFNGQNLEEGELHEFQETLDGSFDNTYDLYVAFNRTMYGYRKGELRNIDTDQTLKKLPDGVNYSPGKSCASNGKIYVIASRGDADCRSITVFDGTNYKEYGFSLPASLDPCSKLLDAEEVDGKLYLLLLSNRQLVIVSRKI